MLLQVCKASGTKGVNGSISKFFRIILKILDFKVTLVDWINTALQKIKIFLTRGNKNIQYNITTFSSYGIILKDNGRDVISLLK